MQNYLPPKSPTLFVTYQRRFFGGLTILTELAGVSDTKVGEAKRNLPCCNCRSRAT
jgi:hypothetical protein